MKDGAASDAGLDTEFHRGLGLFDATMVVVGSMIGSGIFIVPADMARRIGSPGWLLVAWLITGVLTVAAALSYGELAAMMPRAGGQYSISRGVFAAVGLPLRLDAVPGHPDRHHRGGGRRLRPLRRRPLAEHLRGHYLIASVAILSRLCRIAVHGAAGRQSLMIAVLTVDEHLRSSLWQDRAESYSP